MGEAESGAKAGTQTTEFWDVLGAIFGSAWRRFKGLIILAFLLAVISGAAAAWAPKLLQQITDLLIQDPGGGAEFRRLVLLLAGAAFVAVIARFFTSRITFYIATQTEDFWKFKVLGHYYTLPVSWHDQEDSGETGARIDRGASSVYSLINDIFGHDLFIAFVTFVIVLIAALVVAPRFWWIFLAPIPVYVLFTYYMGERMARHQDELNRLADTAGRTMYDGLSNVRSVKAFGKEEEETQRYAQRWSAFHRREYELETVNFTRTSIQNVLEIGMRVVLIVFSFYAISRQEMSVGTMIMLITYQGMLFGPLGQLNSVFARLRRTVRRGSGLFDIINVEDPLADDPHAQDLAPLKDGIAIGNVTFHYGKVPALCEVSFKLQAGTTTALVGRSGSGKSTMTLLLLRFHDPSGGRIRWDGRDLRTATRRSMRRQIALVPQDTSLFNRSIRENIAYGRPGATADEVVDAAKRAHAHEFITAMPHGYDSIIGERGVKLSGGQRQRIAIARALLLNPSLLILDESTSHLDSESEEAIQESIRDLHHKTTQVIIAHRLSTVLHADQIIVMDKGRIVASGTHEELLKTSVYRRLYELQFKKHGAAREASPQAEAAQEAMFR